MKNNQTQNEQPQNTENQNTQKHNSYADVETLLANYKKEQNKTQKDVHLSKLITMLKPLIINSCKHYFGTIDEDQIQDGYEKAINLINAFDQDLTDVKFLGYMKRMLKCYYWDQKRKALKNPHLQIEENYLENLSYKEKGYETIEINDLLNILNPREKEAIIKTYLQGKKQKQVAKELNLSLAYTKETLQKAKQKLRTVICI